MTRDRLLHWLLRIGIWIWFSYWILQIFIGDLGASPALTLNHEMGEIVLILLSMNLLIGILVDLLKPAPRWLRFWILERRFLGVSAFFMLVAHIFFYFLNEGFEDQAFEQMVTKTYLIFGFLCFWIMLILAVTSNNFSVRKLGGKRWRQLHRIVYFVQLLLFGHLLLIEKADVVKYALWLGILLVLQLARFAKKRWAKA